MRAILLSLGFTLSCAVSYAKVNTSTPSKTYSKTPLCFVENKGQVSDQHSHVRSDIRFKLSAAKGLNIFVGDGAVHYQFNREKKGTSSSSFQMTRMDVELVDANKHAALAVDDKANYYENHYSGGSKEGIVARAYNRITYKDVYPSIDWVLYTSHNELKYEFVVRKGGNPANIKLRYSGADNLSLTSSGALVAKTSQGDVVEAAPYTFQADKKAVSSKFKLNGNTVSYEIGAYTGDLVIDPTLAWSTYYGDTAADGAGGAAADRWGNVYLSGATLNVVNIATTGAYQSTYGGGYSDAFLVKFAPNGTRLWATYYGGTGDDNGGAVATDTSGNVFLSGNTTSTSGIATAGAYDAAYGGTGDAFLAKFTSSGTILWATYFGGPAADVCKGVATDRAGNVFLCGYTASTGGIASGGYDATFGGGTYDAFLVKLSSAGAIAWSTYYGNTGSDWANGVAADTGGACYIVGSTSSTSGMASSGTGFSYYGGTSDAYIVKFRVNGTREWAHYYGSATADEFTAVTVNKFGDIFAAGNTNNASGIATTLGTHQSTYGGGLSDGFVTKYNSVGGVKWATYYGGASADYLTCISSDVLGNIFIGGYTNSTSGIATPGAYQTTQAGSEDAFLVKLNQYCIRRWGTYIGGSFSDHAVAVTNDDSGRVFIAGSTESPAGIASSTGFQPAYGGGTTDAFLTKFNDECILPYVGTISGPLIVCPGATVTLTNSAGGGVWSSSNTSVATVSSGGMVTGGALGVAYISYTRTNSCGPKSALFRITTGTPIIKTVAGNMSAVGYDGDGGPAVGAHMWDPVDVVPDNAGNFYISDIGNNRIRKVSAAGIISTFAGDGTSTYAGDGVAATATGIHPAGMAMDNAGNLFVVSTGQRRILKISPAGIVTSVAGTGVSGYTGDGGPATAATFTAPSAIALDDTGNIYVTDASAHVVRKINTSGIIKTIAGTGLSGTGGDDFPATAAPLYTPLGVAVDKAGNVYIAVMTDGHIRKVDPDGIITHYAGSYGLGPIGDGGPAATAWMNPYRLWMDKYNHLFMVDRSHHRIRLINPDGIISTLSGGGGGWDGDGGPALLAGQFMPYGVALDTLGNIYIADDGLCKIRKIQPLDSSTVPIAGTDSLCPGATTTWTNDAYGGTWSSSNAAVATVGSSSGIVTAVASGTAIITYMTNYCTPAFVTRMVYVRTVPATTGNLHLCGGSTTTLSNASPGGFWQVSPTSVATISIAGVVTAVSPGTATVSYTTPSTGCRAFAVVTVNASLPAITPPTPVVCEGYPLTLSNTVTGGSWLSANTAIATINPGGVATGVLAGTTTISYTMGTCSATTMLSVSPTPAAISPAGSVLSMCLGSTTTLTSATGGATWSSSASAIATVSAGGVVTAASPGTANISYTNSVGCAAVKLISVINAPAAIAPAAAEVCVGNTLSLSNTSGGGTWVSDNIAVATVDVTTGAATGVAPGTATISYILSGCMVTRVLTVSAAPAVGSISGPSAVCEGSTATLTNSVGGGTWSSSNTGVATVSGGVVTGVMAGTVIISYNVTAACGTVSTTQTMTVNGLPAAISGPNFFRCPTDTTGYWNSVPGGTWSSSSPSAAPIDATTGIVTSISFAMPTITYTLPTGCYTTKTIWNTPPSMIIGGPNNLCAGKSDTLYWYASGTHWTSSNTSVATIGSSTGIITAVNPGTTTITASYGSMCTHTVTFTTNPAPAILGAGTVCTNNTITLASTVPGGTWSSSNTARATVSSSGVVTGLISGTVTMSYATSAGCTATTIVTVNSSPNVIFGPTEVCVGSTITVGDATVGGTWSSSTPVVGTISAGGHVMGLSPGTTTISYTRSNGCSALYIVTVNFQPAGITGSLNVCVGGTTSLANTTPGGSWNSGTTANATVDVSGVVTGMATGTSAISYSMPTGCKSVAVVTVTAGPAATTGTFSVCVGSTRTLADATPGGTWSSSTPTNGTISTGGVVTGIAPGTTTISYSLASGCRSFAVVTVYAVPAAITGTPLTICPGVSTTLADATPGGSWSSGSTGVATVNTSGVVSGSTAGTTLISYSLPTGCRATTTVTVNPPPSAIGGTLAVCAGLTTTLSNSVSGGTWSSSAPATATISSSGVVTGSLPGVSNISYTLGTGCSTGVTVTVNAQPAAVTGPSVVCETATISLSDATTGGTWISANTAIATVGSTTGIVTGVAAGTTMITYKITASGCFVTRIVSVNPAPSAIIGFSTVCAGSTASLMSIPTGGTWSSSAATTATVGATTGIVTGVSAGTATISYTLGTGCYALGSVTVDPLPDPIGAPPQLCEGTSVMLTETTVGGSWSSSTPAVGTIDIFGIFTGIAAGTTTLTYTLPTSCARTVTITVNPLPAPITGTTGVCEGSTATLTDATAGGTWTSSSTTTATIGVTTGILTGVTAGTTGITYTLPTSCSVTGIATVFPVPAAITGTAAVCAGSVTTLSCATTGGVWSSGATTATITSSGIVTGVTSGTASISYTLTTGCRSTIIVTVNALPAPITGSTTICMGTSTTLSSTTPGGTWSSGTAAIATIGASTGIVNGVAFGTAAITYMLPAGCKRTTTISIDTVPQVKITGANYVCVGKQITLSNSIAGGTWSSSNTSLATVSAGGVVSGVTGGVLIISYSYTSVCGTFTGMQPLTVFTSAQCDSATAVNMVSPVNEPFSIKLFPNPNEGDFSVIVNSTSNEQVQLRIISAVGQEVWKGPGTSNLPIVITSSLVPGVYTLIADGNGHSGMVKFICIRP